MRFSPPDDEVALYKQGFDKDILGRARVGKALSDLLERIEDPLVVALDGRWGTGKSYFLKRWVGAHKSQNGGNATTVYFDAFASDYLSDPLVALVGALGDRMPAGKKSKMKRVQVAATKFIKPLARIGLAAATYGASEALNGLGDAVSKSVGDEAEKGLDQLWQREEGRRAAMEEFRAATASLTASEGDDVSPLIIVIDELDRCRPDYALEVLEVIKHFFSVPRVHFVLGVNLSALENSVRVRYGPGIDAGAYLGKFISLSASLPETVSAGREATKTVVAYARHAAQEMEIPEPISAAFLEHLGVIVKSNSVSIRDIGKILSTLSLLPEEASEPGVYSGWIETMLTLVTAKTVRPDLYGKFLHCTITEYEIADYFGTTDASRKSDNDAYDPESTYRHEIWVFLANQGAIGDPEEARNLAKLFSNYGRLGKVRDFPLMIHHRWLDLFRSSFR